MSLWAYCIGLVLLLVPMASIEAAPLPILKGHLNDYAGVLTAPQREAIEASLTKLESYEGHPQIVILTTRDLKGYDIEGYSIAVARAWGIGQKKESNGLLITTYVAPGADFKVRLEVGYGLEGLIPDATARAIYERKMRPHFRKEGSENYMAAYSEAIAAIDALLRKESTGDVAIDQAPLLEQQRTTCLLILLVGALSSLFLGYIHWVGSGLSGAATTFFLGLFLGLSQGALLGLIFFGFIVGIAAHALGRSLLESIFLAEGSSNGVSLGRGHYHGGYSGGGGFRGGGGSFGGGGYSGGR